MRCFSKLKAEGLTIVLVEQLAYVALENVDYAYVLEHGPMVFEGSNRDLLIDPLVQVSYLGQEDARSMMEAKPELAPLRATDMPALQCAKP